MSLSSGNDGQLLLTFFIVFFSCFMTAVDRYVVCWTESVQYQIEYEKYDTITQNDNKRNAGVDIEGGSPMFGRHCGNP